MKYPGMILLAFALAAALCAQDTKTDLFVGTWKLNVAKSKFKPGPAPQGSTVTIEADGKIAVQEVDQKGQATNWSVTPSEGAPVAVTGLPDMTVIQKRINDRTMEHTWKSGNSIEKGRAVVSKDGKVMTYTLTGTGQDGKPEHDVQVFEKQ